MRKNKMAAQQRRLKAAKDKAAQKKDARLARRAVAASAARMVEKHAASFEKLGR